MTDLSDFVRRLVEVLDRLRLPYMFVGSAASTLHGPPRSTQDIDLVVVLTLEDVHRLVGAFPDDDYYVNAEAVRDAVLRRYAFNITEMESGWKADFMVLKVRPFSRTELPYRSPAPARYAAGLRQGELPLVHSSAGSARTYLALRRGSPPQRTPYSPSSNGRSSQGARRANAMMCSAYSKRSGGGSISPTWSIGEPNSASAAPSKRHWRAFANGAEVSKHGGARAAGNAPYGPSSANRIATAGKMILPKPSEP